MRSSLISLHPSRKCLTHIASLTALGVIPVLAPAPSEAQAPAPPAANMPIPADLNNGDLAMKSMLKPQIEIEFQDIPVTDLLIQIAKLGNVEISIKGDVGGTLKFVRYKNVTADEAIERVASDAGLFWGRRGEQYVITRVLEELPFELQARYRNAARNGNSSTPGALGQGGLGTGPGSEVPANPFPLPPVTGIELESGPGGTLRVPNTNNFQGIPDLIGTESTTKKRGKQTNFIKVKNVKAAMIAYWLDPVNNAPDIITQMSNDAHAQGRDTRTLRPVDMQGNFNLLGSSYGNQARPGNYQGAYPYPYAGQYPAYPAAGYGPYGAPYAPQGYGPQGYGPYMAGSYMMRGVSNGVPFASSNFPQQGIQTGMQGVPLFNNNFNLQQENSWSNVVSNSNPWTQRPIGSSWMQANPQFGQRQGQQGGRFGQGGQGGQGQGGQGQGSVFELPEGIDSMVAIDAQNSLLVRGTAEAVEELQQLIELIDQPLRQVEIEAQFVSITSANTKFFGIDFSGSALPFTLSATTNPNNITGNFNVGVVSRNFQATLNSLVSNNRAKIVTAPRVVAINNLTASLQSQTITTVLLSQAAINPGNGGNGNVVATAQVPFQVQTSIGITVAPTINGDGTITVLLQPQVQQQGLPTSNNPIPQVTAQTVQTVAIVRDGDTIALGGLRNKRVQNTKQRIPFLSNIPIIGRLFQSVDKSDSDEDLIIFLTAREVRRLDESQPVPGT